jgi:hypothetical protein
MRMANNFYRESKKRLKHMDIPLCSPLSIKELTMTTQNLSDAKLRRSYKRWSADRAYTKQMKVLTKAQGFGYFCCVGFNMTMSIPFEWSQTTAQTILKKLRKTQFLNAYIEASVHKGGIPLEEALEGIEYFRKMNAEAQIWARTLLHKYVSECDTCEPLLDESSINEWLSDTTLEMPELMRLHMDSPMLHGQIYLELEKLVVAACPDEDEDDSD